MTVIGRNCQRRAIVGLFFVERIAVIYVAHVVILICLKPSLPAIRLIAACVQSNLAAISICL